MVKRLSFLIAVGLILAACRGNIGGSATGDNTDTETRVKISDEVVVAPLPLPADETDGPTERGATSITSDAAAACLTADEAELAHLINEYRASLNLPAVPLSKSMTLVAQQHAWDSETNGNAWPPPPAGKTCNMHSWTDRVNPALQEGTWTAVCYTNDHDNSEGTAIKPEELAGYPGVGVENSYFSISTSGGATPSGALTAWKNSPGHNAVITEQGWARPKAMGVGINGGYAHLWFGYVADPAGVAQLCSGQPRPTATTPPPTPTPDGTVEAADAPPTPAGTIVATAGSRRSGTEILNENGTIAAGGLNQHQFQVSRGGVYTVTVTPSAQLDVDPTIGCNTDGGGVLFHFDWNWQGTAETFSFDTPGNGNCTVTIRGYEDSTGTYNIKVTAG